MTCKMASAACRSKEGLNAGIGKRQARQRRRRRRDRQPAGQCAEQCGADCFGRRAGANPRRRNRQAVVLACAGRTFIAGADITEFDKPPMRPGTGDVIATVDAMAKPVVAALDGTTLGGGLEVALGCHFRLAALGSRLGLPEIKLGLIPGAGGTQRLPRLIGMEKALRMILSGDPIGAGAALEAGLIDAIVDGDVTAGAIAFARKLVADKTPLRRAQDLTAKLAGLKADRAKFDELVAAHSKRSRGLHAPAAAVEVLRAAIELPIDQGLKLEHEKFMALKGGDQSKAQRHIFFAERAASKSPTYRKTQKPKTLSAPPSLVPAPWAAASPCALPTPAFR